MELRMDGMLSPPCLRTCPAQVGGECECGGRDREHEIHGQFGLLHGWAVDWKDRCPCAWCRDRRRRREADQWPTWRTEEA